MEFQFADLNNWQFSRLWRSIRAIPQMVDGQTVEDKIEIILHIIEQITNIWPNFSKVCIKMKKILKNYMDNYRKIVNFIGAARGNTGNVHLPEMGNCCRKMMLFPKVLFLAATFLKSVKNSILLLNFYQIFFIKFSKFPKNVFFVQTR